MPAWNKPYLGTMIITSLGDTSLQTRAVSELTRPSGCALVSYILSLSVEISGSKLLVFYCRGSILYESFVRLVIIIVPKYGLFHASMVKSRLYSPLQGTVWIIKVPPPDLVTQIRTSLRYLSLKHRCVWVDKTLGLRPRVLSTQTQLCFAELYLPDLYLSSFPSLVYFMPAW